MFLIGYGLGLLGLFIACGMVKGFYFTLAVYGSVHVGCTLVLLLLWHRSTHTPRQRCPSSALPVTRVRLVTTDPEREWVIAVHLN